MNPVYNTMTAAVTFGEQSAQYVDLYSFQVLQSNNQLLQNTNLRLQDDVLKLQKQLTDEFLRRRREALTKEFLKFNGLRFTEDPAGFPHVVVENKAGDWSDNPLSDSRCFRVNYLMVPPKFDPEYEITAILPCGNKKSVRIPVREYDEKHLYKALTSIGVTVTYGKPKDAAGYLYTFISGKLGDLPPMIPVPDGWYSDSTWKFNPGSFCKLDDPLIEDDDLDCDGKVILLLLKVYSLLASRMTDPRMYIDRPFFLLGGQHSDYTLSMDEKPTRFQAVLESTAFSTITRVYAGVLSAGTAYNQEYKSATNYANLSGFIERYHPNTVFVVSGKEISPLGHKYCLPVVINDSHQSHPTGCSSITIGQLVSYVLRNPDHFDYIMRNAYEKNLTKIDEEHDARTVMASLATVAEYTTEFLKTKGTAFHEEFMKAAASALGSYEHFWDRLETDDLPQRLKEALFSAKKERLMTFLDLDCPEGEYCREDTVLFDDYFYYFPTKLLRVILSRYIKEYQTEIVLKELGNAGIIGAVQRKYFTLDGSHYEIKVRPIARSFAESVGQRKLNY